MKICLVVDDSIYRSGGVQYNVLNNANWFKNHGHAVTILHAENPDVEKIIVPRGIEIISIAEGKDIRGLNLNGSVSPFPGFADRKNIRKILESKQFDVVHFNYPFSPFVSGRILKEVKRLRNLGKKSPKTVCSMQIYVEEKFAAKTANILLSKYMRSVLKTVDIFTHSSKPTLDYGHEYLQVESVRVPLGVESIDISSKTALQSESKDLTILFLGRLEERKGVIDFIEALNKIKSQLGKTSVTIAGDGPQRRDAERLAATYQLPVKFLGRVTDEERNNAYLSSDIAIFPSKFGESFGIVLVEAMNYGCAICGYANPGYHDTMNQFSERCLVEPGNIGKLSEMIYGKINDRAGTFKEGVQLKSYFEMNYSLDVTCASLLKLYR